MPDAFRPEVLAAFMQQVVDETVLPVLFLRTVSPPFVSRRFGADVLAGHPSCHDVQVAAAIRLDDAPLSPNRKKGLDDGTALGGLHPLRKGHRTSLFRGALAASRRAAQGCRREAANAAVSAPRMGQDE